MNDERAPADVKRWLVTIGAIGVYFVGGRIPLPGVDVHAVGGEATRLMSLFGLGVTPIISSLVVMEIARLTVPPLARWRAKGTRQAHLYARIARALALGFAALQALGIAEGLKAANVVIDDGGWPFRLEIVVALVGATAVVIWLAELINAEGVGDGLVILLATFAARLFPGEVVRWWLYARQGFFGADVPVLLLALTVLSVAALVAVSRREVRSGPLDLWSPLLGWAVTPYVGGLIALLQARVVALLEEAGVEVGIDWGSPLGIGGGVLNVLVLAGLIAVAALRRAYVDKLDRTMMFWPQIAVEIVVCCGGRLLMYAPGGVSGAVGLGVILSVAAALSVLPGWRGGRALAPG
jgi:hypothetical protein